MERSSGKHGPLRDDELARETEPLVRGAPQGPRADEFRDPEEPEPDELGLPSDPVLARRELSRHLELHAFPGDRERLLAAATDHRAPEPVLAVLRRLPADAVFDTVHELWQTIEARGLHGGQVDDRSSERDFEARSEGRRRTGT